jgi:predicted O-methyltransferase YrrM
VALEVGTLGGYSAAWIARGLDRDGRLITIEREPAYAAFAARELAGLSLGPKIEVRQGDALAVLGGLEEELGAESLDFAFVDADKSQYLDYWRAIDPCLKPGAIFVADNALGTGSWWIDELDHPERRGVHALNQALADHPGYDTALFPLREGLLVALKR